MKPFDVVVDHELFRISERRQPAASRCYEFVWLNGPMDGTYVLTVGRFATISGGDASDVVARMTEEELIAEARGFARSVYEPGGIAEENFPDHIPAKTRQIREQ
ncbi:hypothetical protein [Arthrobacter sp. HLT1-21]